MSFKITITKNGQTKQYEEFSLEDALKHLNEGSITTEIQGDTISVKCDKS
jgi:hypothetical protein